MKTYRELLHEGRVALTGGWIWRLFACVFVLDGVASLVGKTLSAYHDSRGIITLGDYLKKTSEAAQQGIAYSLPNAEAVRSMFVATSFECFVWHLFTAIALLGFAAIALRACEKKDEAWFSSSLVGFRRPLGAFTLFFVMNLFVFLWSLLLLVPGLVALYRYRAAWYLKSEDPEQGALQCLDLSSRMMKGFKFQAFVLDLLFILILIPAILLGVVATCLVLVFENGLATFLFVPAFCWAFYVGFWAMTTRGAFYLSVKAAYDHDIRRDSREDQVAHA